MRIFRGNGDKVMELEHLAIGDPKNGKISAETNYLIDSVFPVTRSIDGYRQLVQINDFHQFILAMNDEQFELLITKMILECDPILAIDWYDKAKELKERREKEPDNRELF